MKKSFIITLALTLVTGMASAQWAVNGSNINNTNAGNVGIGTNTPAFKLDVQRFGNPQIQVKNTGGAAGATFRMVDDLSGADFSFKSTSTGGFKIRDNAFATDVLFIESNSGANSLYISASGNVGIGFDSPGQKLDVNGNLNATGDYYVNSKRIIRDDGFGRTQYFFADDGNLRLEFTTHNSTFWNKDVYATHRLGVGLDPGVESISTTLDVNGNVRVRSLSLDNTKDSVLVASGDGTLAYRDASTLAGAETDPSIGALSNNKVPRWNGSQLVNSTIFNDGIGGTGGTTILGSHIIQLGDNTVTNALFVNLVRSSSTARIYLGSGGSAPNLFINTQTASGDIAMVTAGGEVMRIVDGGQVGILTSTPSSDLEIKQSDSPVTNPTGGGITLVEAGVGITDEWQMWNSNDFLSFAWNNTRVAYVNNATGDWTTTSDQRFKKDIEPMENVLSKVMELKPMKYRYIHNTNADAKQRGFIAQDVQKVFPDMVYTEDGSQLALSRSDFGVLAIKAIQEQQQQIVTLTQRITELENRLNQMGQ